MSSARNLIPRYVPKYPVGVPYNYEKSDHPYIQCWLVFSALSLIVVIQVSVVVYSDTGHEHTQPKEIPYVGDPVVDLRSNMGLDIGNDTSPGAMAFLKPEDNVTEDIFTEQYTEMCEMYFLPREVNSEQTFRRLFQRLTSHINVTDAVTMHNMYDNFVRSILSNNNTKMDPKVNQTMHMYNKKTSQDFSLRGTSMPVCPCVPGNLIGAINVSFDVPHLGEMELTLPDIRSGGHWAPPDCLARHRTAIIIPFRDREQHLQILLNYLHPLLQRQMLYYTIFVVEQVYPAVFNKASVMNVGYKEATLADSFDCFIFHDVDMIPENDHNFYTCTPQPRHVGSHCDKFNYEVPYASVFGGVTAFTGEQFLTANGFSNDFYGWGGEDDDMYQRVKATNMTISRYPGSISRYTMIKHGSDSGNPYNRRATVGFRSRPRHYRHSGLNSLRYYIPNKSLRPLYTWMQVELPDRILTEIYTDAQQASIGHRTHPMTTVNLAFIICILLIMCS